MKTLAKKGRPCSTIHFLRPTVAVALIGHADHPLLMDDVAVNHFPYELLERGGGVRMKRAHFEGRGLLKLELDCRSRRARSSPSGCRAARGTD
jgi:hypothetical protein